MISLLCTVCSVLAVPLGNTTNDSAPDNVSLRRAQTASCCGGGAACGWVPCPLGNVPCVRPWQMPDGMTWPDDCLDTQIVIAPDVCASAPCLNGAVCSSTDQQSFTCLCTSGYTGATCDVALNSAYNGNTLLGVADGGRCAAGFCENVNDCPQCAVGLQCVTPTNQLCAGTCYGRCTSTIISPPLLSTPTPAVAPQIPQDCSVWYDGCNTCAVVAGSLAGCTRRACVSQGTPTCTAHGH